MSVYPKWVQRTPEIGPVLCLDAKQEQDLLEAWDEEQLEAARKAAKVAEATAVAAKEMAEVALKQTTRK